MFSGFFVGKQIKSKKIQRKICRTEKGLYICRTIKEKQ